MDQLIKILNLFVKKDEYNKDRFPGKQVNVECNIIVLETFARNKSAKMINAMLFAQQTNGVSLKFIMR